MLWNNTESHLLEIVADTLVLSGNNLTLLERDLERDTKLADIRMDEDDRVEILIEIEAQFGVDLDEAEIDRCETIGDLIEVVAAACKEQ